ncbi:MAG TPA: hypothetical protein VD999_05520 [Vitreimonas sp.]|nr:hypothetical protein [Vitreimonas sp.]
MILNPELAERYPQPVLPQDGKVEWGNIFSHYTTSASILQILSLGILSKKLASRAYLPYFHFNIPKVQEAEGYEWISVSHINENGEGIQEKMKASSLMVLTRKLIRKSRPAQSEEAFSDEWLVKNRIAPRDLVAVWLSEAYYHRKIGQIVMANMQKEQVLPWIDFVIKNDSRWQKRIEKLRKHYLDKLNRSIMFQGEAQSVIDAELNEIIFIQFVRHWLSAYLNFDATEVRVSDVVAKLLPQLSIPIYIIIKNETEEHQPVLLGEYQKLNREIINDDFWDEYQPFSYWVE